MSRTVLWKIFYMLFGIVFLNLALRTVFLNYCYDYPLLPVVGCAVLMALLLLAARWLLQKFPLFCRHPKKVLAAAMTVQFIVLAWMGVHLETVGNNDFGSVYHSAETWVLEGRFPEIGYFSIYPNNMGAFLLLKDVFQGMHLLGIDRFFYGGLFLNLLSIFFAMTGVYTLAKRLFDVKTALLAVFAFAIWPPLYFWVAVFYTDMLTLGFLPWVLVFIVKAKDALEVRQYKAAAVHLAAAALTAALGACIKSVVWIVLIAGLVWLALQCRPMQFAAAAGGVLAVCVIVAALFQARVGLWLSPQDREKAFPMEHWIMMGLVGDGSYNHADYLVSASIEDPDECTAYARQQISERLQSRDLLQFLKFTQIKQLRSFGSGNADVHHFLEAGPKTPGIALQFGASYGEYHFVYEYLSQGWLVVMLFSLAAVGVQGFLRPQAGIKMGLCSGSMFGLWLFLLIWEAGQRYIIAGIPMAAVLMACAAQFVVRAKNAQKTGSALG